jgi:hypothetical protein
MNPGIAQLLKHLLESFCVRSNACADQCQRAVAHRPSARFQRSDGREIGSLDPGQFP